jgi:hypothetical protein
MQKIDHLRLAFERRFAIVRTQFDDPTPPMRAFLALPIQERLILLALTDLGDKADEETVRALLPFARQSDIRLKSERMREALKTFQKGLVQPTFFIDLGNIPLETDHTGDLTDMNTKTICRDADVPQDIERSIRWVFYPSAAPMLIGPMVTSPVSDWPLLDRLCLYLLVVEELTYRQVEELMGCTEWRVRESLRIALEEFKPELEILAL